MYKIVFLIPFLLGGTEPFACTTPKNMYYLPITNGLKVVFNTLQSKYVLQSKESNEGESYVNEDLSPPPSLPPPLSDKIKDNFYKYLGLL